MTDHTLPHLPRRRFLQGAACILGAATLGRETHADAAAPPTKPLSVGFWDGRHLQDAARLNTGDRSLTEARLTIVGAPQSTATLHAIHVHYRVAVDGQETWLPHYAWAHDTHKTARSMTHLPVTPDGILLAVRQEQKRFVHLTPDAKPGTLGLRVGTYVIAAAASPTWGAYLFQPDAEHPLTRRSLHGPTPASFDYVTVRVEAA